MVFELLQAAGRGPGLLTGGALAGLQAAGHLGNAWAPAPPADRPPLLVIEADESDGSLVRYAPWLGVVLNLGLDHKSPAEVMEMFRTFVGQTTGPLVLGADSALDELAGPDTLRFGLAGEEAGRAGVFADDLQAGPDHVAFRVDGVDFRMPGPGGHGVLNATAALAVGRLCGLELAEMAAPLAAFGGVARRFVSVGTAGGVEVIDDFAHNPDKIAAALAAARDRTTGRVLAVFQPHGYGPTRFLRDALVATFSAELDPADVLWLPEIYYAGGTVTRDISAADLVTEIAAAGRDARFLAERAALPKQVAAEARPGDLVLVMGARDPGLTDLCRQILARIGEGGD
jgi:UDP-N-acetylmuramate--alanine ligase